MAERERERRKVAIQDGANSGFRSMQRGLKVSQPFSMGRESTPSNPQHVLRLALKFFGAYVYSYVERGAVRVRCLGHEHSTT